MDVFVCFSHETGFSGVEVTYRGTETSLPKCLKYLKPSSKFNPGDLHEETRPEDGKHYFIIPDGDERYLIIFADKLKDVNILEETEDKKTVRVEEPAKKEPDPESKPKGTITVKI